MTDMPLHHIYLIVRLFLQICSVACFIYLKKTKNDSRLEVVLTRIVYS